eukprot:gene3185-6282_t
MAMLSLLAFLFALSTQVAVNALEEAIEGNFPIKLPQLFGIIAGCLVFTVTIVSVVILLFRSGTFSRLQAEIQSGQPINFNLNGSSHLSSFPELYDSLILASQTLPITPNPPKLSGKLIQLRLYEDGDLDIIYDACNGRAQYHESAYDPDRIWGWIDITNEESTSTTSIDNPWLSKDLFKKWIQMKCSDKASCHMVILDPKLQKPVGMIRLSMNSPRNLSINLDWIWITPAYQGEKFGHEAILLLLQWLVSSGYRRISCEIDSRHMILKKFLERCGFKLEAILRKHRIIARRNRDTAVYSILNSDWNEEEFKLKKYIGIPITKVHKVAEIDKPVAITTTMKKENKNSLQTSATTSSSSMSNNIMTIEGLVKDSNNEKKKKNKSNKKK